MQGKVFTQDVDLAAFQHREQKSYVVFCGHRRCCASEQHRKDTIFNGPECASCKKYLYTGVNFGTAARQSRCLLQTSPLNKPNESRPNKGSRIAEVRMIQNEKNG